MNFSIQDFLNIDWTDLLETLFLPGCILAASLFLGLSLNSFLKKKAADKVSGSGGERLIIEALHGVPVSFCLVVGLYWIVNTVNLPPSLTKIFSYILFSVIAFTVSRVIARTLTGLVNLRLKEAKTNIPKTSLLGSIISGVIYVVAVIIVLQYCGISVTPIITAMGVGGMALALGMQDILANLFAGIHLSVASQLRVGEYIKLASGEEGQITDISWRYTTIRTILGNMVVVPNKNLASLVVVNYSQPVREFSVKVTVGVDYGSDLEKVKRVALAAAQKVLEDANVKNPKPSKLFFTEFDESSINFFVLLHSPSFEQQAGIKSAFIMELTKRFREENINIPFPIRTVISQ